MKRFVTSGDLQRMFLAEDHKTIIRRPNCRKFCLDNDIYMEIHEKAWLIEIKPFMDKINPRKIGKHYELPQMRNIAQFSHKSMAFLKLALKQIIAKYYMSQVMKIAWLFFIILTH